MGGLDRGIWDLYVVTDRKLACGRSHEEVAAAALAGGSRVIQLRDKEMTTRELIDTGLRLKEIVHEAGGILIINDRVDVALAVDADGVHLGQDDMPAALARRMLGREKIIGVSVSSEGEALAAELDGADYLGASAIFATPTKTDAAPIGLDGLRKICDSVRIPVVAIGGINKGNIEQVIKAGAAGIAVVSAVVSAPDIGAAARELLQEVRRAKASMGRCAAPGANAGTRAGAQRWG
ncbi:MAG TPA: thiamine phosphate synthase [Firmicutes bacterium]|nr:thiamine phosphate synthase [Bacillota bacterium]